MSPRHCEPTGRANARPMGSAKQSIYLLAASWIASSLLLLAMTAVGCLTIEPESRRGPSERRPRPHIGGRLFLATDHSGPA